MADTALSDNQLGTLLEAIGAKTPAPGGGAVAAIVGALGAALGNMVVSYSIGRKSLAAHQPMLENAAARLGRARDLMIELAEEDAAAFERVGELLKLPADDPRRVSEMQDAVWLAVQPPRAALGAAADLLRLLEELVAISNRNLRSDLAIAALLAEAAARAAWWNVAANLASMEGDPRRAGMVTELQGLLRDAADRSERVQKACEW
ncbi:MAG: cyclodeaminase/cyclohydrolase family protein [Phycisphaerales bacterium]|nr:cyclodeaminase/cyclohydrolase family protein [Phycisphaerales bacterium]